MHKRLLQASLGGWPLAMALLVGCSGDPPQAMPDLPPPEPPSIAEQEDRTLGLPLVITIENVPEVPERLLGPTLPVEETEGEEQ
jgi:hypothetical protein